MRKTMLIPFALMALPVQLPAQSYDNLASVEVLTGWRNASGTHMAAIEITLEPGWVTYWRAPGDAGIPPQFAFSGSDHINSITPHWPTPAVFGENGMRSVGYYDSVVVPLAIDLSDPNADVAMRGEMLIGVCEEICIPVTLRFDALLPVTSATDARISAALADHPVSAASANVGKVACVVDPITDGLRMTATIDMPTTGHSEHVVVETGDPTVWVSEAVSHRDADTLHTTVEMVHPNGKPFALDRSSVRFTVLGSDRAVDIHGCSAG